MAKTSITNYVMALGYVGLVVTALIFAYGLADLNYDISDIDTTPLQTFGNLTETLDYYNSTGAASQDVSADEGLFDIIGGLILKAGSVAKVFISAGQFLSKNFTSMMSFLGIPSFITTTIVGFITILLAAALIFRIFLGREDEKQ